MSPRLLLLSHISLLTTALRPLVARCTAKTPVLNWVANTRHHTDFLNVHLKPLVGKGGYPHFRATRPLKEHEGMMVSFSVLGAEHDDTDTGYPDEGCIVHGLG